MRIGARIHDIFQADTDDFSDKLKASDIPCVQLTLGSFFKDYDFVGGAFSDVKALNVKNGLIEAGVCPSVLSCYINPINPNGIESEIQLFKKFVDYAEKIGVNIIGTETGTMVNDFENDFSANHTSEVFDSLVSNMKEAVQYAQQKGIRVGIECVSYFPIHSAESIQRFIDLIDLPNVCAIFDPVNLLNITNYNEQDSMILNFMEKMHNKICVVHLKDFVVSNGKILHVPLFEGDFHIEKFIELLKQYNVNCDIILENTNMENYYPIKQKLEKILSK